NTTIPFQQRDDAPKIDLRTSRNTKHTVQYGKGSCAPFMYAHDGKRTWVLRFPARQQFTASKIEVYAFRREGEGMDMAETTTP
ncbi:hypothetical protein K469DRAFT_701427, partial [Zopfia rhizophila CBS 207.26]